MHGRNLSVTNTVGNALSAQTETSAARTAEFSAMLEGRAQPTRGARNLFGPIRSADMFSACDRMRPGQVEASVRVLMRRLSIRMRRGYRWPDLLAGAREAGSNPNLPSGYTYLLQLIAHDIVDSTISLAKGAGINFGFANARRMPLSLETIYGGGPDVSPQAYEFTADHHGSTGLVPSTPCASVGCRNRADRPKVALSWTSVVLRLETLPTVGCRGRGRPLVYRSADCRRAQRHPCPAVANDGALPSPAQQNR